MLEGERSLVTVEMVEMFRGREGGSGKSFRLPAGGVTSTAT